MMRFASASAVLCVGVAIRSSDNFDEVFAQGLATEGTAKRFWRRCPAGLRRNQTQCIYDSPRLWKPTEDEAYDLGWNTSGDVVPLVFRRDGGHFHLEDAFIAELAIASADKGIAMQVFTGLAELEVRTNLSLRERFNKFRDSSMDILHNLDPVTFAIEEWGIHTILHALAVWGHDIAHKAHAGHGWGAGVIEALGDGASDAIHFYLDTIFPIIIGPYILYRFYRIRDHWLHRTHHAKGFVMRMIMRSQCVANELKLEKSGVESIVKNFQGEVQSTCGDDYPLLLAKQMQSSNLAMVRLFETYAKIGRCMWPADFKAGGYASKIQCVNTLYWPLFETQGYPGILFEGLATAALYAEQTDTLMVEPIYGRLIQDKFEMHPEGDEAHLNILVSVLGATANGPAEEGEKCMQVLAMHRAFERTFARLIVATEVYLETFARWRWVPNLAGRWKPCTKVFYSVKDSEKKRTLVQGRDFHLRGFRPRQGHASLRRRCRPMHFRVGEARLGGRQIYRGFPRWRLVSDSSPLRRT